MANNRLIDANVLISNLRTFKGLGRTVAETLVRFTEKQPTVDAVEVVRCKDCKYYREGKIWEGINFCFRLRGSDGEPVGYNFSDDDFCSRGERRNDG